jgi:hypothetical protein
VKVTRMTDCWAAVIARSSHERRSGLRRKRRVWPTNDRSSGTLRRRSWAAAAGPAKSNLTRMQRNHHAPRPLGSLSLPVAAEGEGEGGGVGDLRWQTLGSGDDSAGPWLLPGLGFAYRRRPPGC